MSFQIIFPFGMHIFVLSFCLIFISVMISLHMELGFAKCDNVITSAHTPHPPQFKKTGFILSFGLTLIA